MRARMCRNPRHRCYPSAEEEILEYLRLGAGLQLAAILSDVSICRVEDYVEAGLKNPAGIHGEFARAVKALQPAQKPQSTTLSSSSTYRARHGIGLQTAGNGSNGNSQHLNGGNGHTNGDQLLARWDD
jgi:hypothetical protein